MASVRTKADGMPETAQLLLGTHYHPGNEDTARRQAECRATLLALTTVQLVNLQFPDQILAVKGFETLPTLFTDSIKASGLRGVRKPVGNEAFDRLANCALAIGTRWFGWVNSDVQVTQKAVDRVLASELQSVVMSRMDFDRHTGEDDTIFVGGQDAFFFRTDWWFRHGKRFRAYVNSEAYWDNVYTAVALCHGRAELWNREPLIRHEIHARVWRQSPFAVHNRYLAGLDTLYWERWDRYKRRLLELRNRGATEPEELQLQRECFDWPPGVRERLKHGFRVLRVRWRGRNPRRWPPLN